MSQEKRRHRGGHPASRKRLLGIPGVKPFVVRNLGKCERQAWQAAEFAGAGSSGAGGENALRGRLAQPADKGSFDSVAARSAHGNHAQDDREFGMSVIRG
jgi:hypothetical protein